jgi:hypothetical protein
LSFLYPRVLSFKKNNKGKKARTAAFTWNDYTSNRRNRPANFLHDYNIMYLSLTKETQSVVLDFPWINDWDVSCHLCAICRTGS